MTMKAIDVLVNQNRILLYCVGNEIDMVYFFSREKTIAIIDSCIESNKCYKELYPKDPNAIAY